LAVLNFHERMFVKAMYREQMANLHGDAFEDFFHRLMSARYSDFVQVRTHGNIGDLGADGLRLHNGRLYACYAPEVFDATKAGGKFANDLAKAIRKRSGEFGTFVFVYNDARGLHPEVSRLLAQARVEHSRLEFEPMGPQHLLRKLFELVRHEIEDLLRAPILVEEVVYGVGLEDLTPLLQHLMEHRRRADGQAAPREVSALKMDYNRLGEDDRTMLRIGMRHTHLIEQYYQGIADVTERDEVAADFNAYYGQIADEYDESEQVLAELRKYVAGNQRGTSATEIAWWVVVAYFFETCDIFREPPARMGADQHRTCFRMIVPTKGIAPQRSLLAVGAQILQTLDRPMTVSQAWTTLRQWRRDHGHHAPVPFWWFVLALDSLHAIGVVELREELLVTRRVDAAAAQRV